ncbi:multicomponent K+:H+ antiporter subunit F [Terrimicrobium sacchariphilum]|jgi:multisubunit Na+/H+ antiporter MnhF subunit|uniref:Multicomponent K+:H+ antiporter subunit F n=1 Tax=Terrimicrobium sacchariphilum TaxID=690879 RepID=A0A146G822_TERSA|nr:monovalent cation/H+ antiporter complex subunit F [Terrimicrobium sacchariphilum]GAT33631.1 multicomponent K+:H+ antiporter subunit F [Terrimicrobium sacchariphilum]
MMTIVVILALALLIAASMLALVRVLMGPTIIDRIIAFDLVAISIVGMMVILSVWWKTQLFIEIMLIFSLLGFVGTVAFVCYLHNDPSKLKRVGKKEPSKKETP